MRTLTPLATLQPCATRRGQHGSNRRIQKTDIPTHHFHNIFTHNFVKLAFPYIGAAAELCFVPSAHCAFGKMNVTYCDLIPVHRHRPLATMLLNRHTKQWFIPIDLVARPHSEDLKLNSLSVLHFLSRSVLLFYDSTYNTTQTREVHTTIAAAILARVPVPLPPLARDQSC